jgi:CBS domain-containing protein
MGKIRNILETKGKKIISVTPDTTVYAALELMYDKNISAVLVIENDKLVGIFSERDYARKVILKGKSSKETRVKDIMTREVITITPDWSVNETMQLMTTKFIRHIPVLENDELLGIVSIGDVVKFHIEDQEFIINNLEHYITGT